MQTCNPFSQALPDLLYTFMSCNMAEPELKFFKMLDIVNETRAKNRRPGSLRTDDKMKEVEKLTT